MDIVPVQSYRYSSTGTIQTIAICHCCGRWRARAAMIMMTDDAVATLETSCATSCDLLVGAEAEEEEVSALTQEK